MAQDGQSSGNKWLLPAVGLGAVVIVIILLIALCSGGGGDDDDDSGSDDQGNVPTATADDGGGDETPAATDDSGDDSTAALEELSARWGDASGKIVYEFKSSAGGTETTSKMTYFIDPPNSRTDFEGEDGEVTSFIQAGDRTYICSAGSCLSYPGGGAINPIPFVGDYAYPDAINETIGDLGGIEVDRSEDEIAGVDVTCFKVEVAGSETGWCFSDDGLLLLSSSRTAGSEFEMRATEVDTDVSDADFEPPFEVIELPGT